jgi:GNAT superfamily N-acetyltransferase
MSDLLQIVTQRTSELSPETRNAIIRLCIDAHQNPEFEHLFTYLPPDGLHVMAYLGERLVSHAVVTTRWIQPEGHPILKSAYVDAVSTAPDVQGQGYGSAMMRHLASVISTGDAGYQIAGLQTDDRMGFYAQVGWEVWRGALAGRADDGRLTYTPEQREVMILRLPQTPALNLEGLLTVEISGRIWE